jgi:regulatory protein NPR1
LTRPKDYNENTKQGQESNKDRICIDVLETDMRRRNSMSANVSTLSPSVADDLSMKLDYLENRGDKYLFILSNFFSPMLKMS